MTETRRIAKIKSTMLGYEDHGILSSMLYVEYGGSSQGVGGYAFDSPTHDAEGNFTGRIGCAYGMEFVARTLKACGVNSWEKLPGRTIFVLLDGDDWFAKVIGIEPLPTEPGTRFLFADLADLCPS